jgi:glycine cleavage system H protein
MPEVRGCQLPDELLYDVENHIWFKELDDGNVKLGMTTVATAMAGQLVAFTPKKVGRAVQPGKSCATVESGKWVGPAKSAAGGEIVAVNEDVVGKPTLANDDPYGAGWLVILKPEDWAAAKAALVPGTQVAGPYEAKMTADGFAGCACAPGAQS